MGDPKRQKKKYETPRFPWRRDVLQAELKLIGEYGLRNKHELWRHRTTLSNFRGNARSLLGVTSNDKVNSETQLLNKLKRLGILHETAIFDNILDLTIRDILERRLQTIIFRKGLSKSIYQSRQLIIHGHIAVKEKKVFSPSYIVPKSEEDKIKYASTSPLLNLNHPLLNEMKEIKQVEDVK